MIKKILPLVASPLMVGFFSPCLLDHDVGNGNNTVRDSREFIFLHSRLHRSLRKNIIPTSPQMRITSVLGLGAIQKLRG